MDEKTTTQNSGLTDYELMLCDLADEIRAEECTLKCSKILDKKFKELMKYSFDNTDKSQISDGYHTFEELYEHRNVLFMALCQAVHHGNVREIYNDSVFIWKTRFDFENKYCGDDWFIMGIGTKKGKQISYHLPFKFWDKCEFAQTLDKVPAFDGHQSKDVIDRLLKLYIGKL